MSGICYKVESTGAAILLVEDNLSVGNFAQEMLQDLGYETTWAANAKEALGLLADSLRRFDLVFSDVIMPSMNTIALGEEIRRLRPGLPVVLTSGYSDVLAAEGSHGFVLIQKPYSVEVLAQVLLRSLRDSAPTISDPGFA